MQLIQALKFINTVVHDKIILLFSVRRNEKTLADFFPLNTDTNLRIETKR